MITIDISNDQSHVPLDDGQLRRVVRMILEDELLARAEISVAVVDDPTIRRLHREYLGQDEPTDVLSFVLERCRERLEGEVIVSAEMAAATAPRFGWTTQDELLLYVIHGTLHLVGYDDTTPEQQAEMRRQERAYLAHCGLKGRYEESGEPCGEADVPAPDPASGGKKLP